MKLWSMPSSGNSYKVRLLLALLGRDCEIVDVEYQTPALEKAHAEGRLPFGKAPVLELDDGQLLPESNAILCYLGEGTRLVPADPADRARMLAWMFWEQNQHEAVIAVRGALLTYPHRRAQATPERLAELLTRGHQLLQIMENRLRDHDWLVGDAISLADVCLYGYTHSAERLGGYDLGRYPGITAWLARIAAQPGYRGLGQ
ncbi:MULTISPECIES: glutathione S-transferase family protein [unclassified Paracoccus (in: a-proteobacteria)]|uniref:glutathione S-transferase family protein n=1 Tax=unclassified Paracoccus (in: a-proteobacteria) TaxID=2688777 RepID=UPI0012B2787D|nr:MULTISPECIES: glutathione S-transferase family protein [unclassified Paracoccus (in: a-proteobacteria)]UXU74750.1 glutathione S-transferase family protein [Paracoccus sp. SMMA_5]UXU80647.1 glutathione S-transferase family protein [Paracoccus sp. SMMA_5_TC]